MLRYRVARWWRLAVRDTDPGYFAVVMATCIVSRAMQLDGAARLAGDGHAAAAAVLLGIGGISWVLLSYGLPWLLASTGRQAVLAGANGSWFLWPVATQAVAVGLSSWPTPLPAGAANLALACWAVGVVGYLLVASLVTAALLAFPGRPAELTPGYWVFMGASAISVLAGAQILRLPPTPAAATHVVVAGLSVVLWAFGSWLVPLLVIAGIWRHARHRVPLGYEPGCGASSSRSGCTALPAMSWAARCTWGGWPWRSGPRSCSRLCWRCRGHCPSRGYCPGSASGPRATDPATEVIRDGTRLPIYRSTILLGGAPDVQSESRGSACVQVPQPLSARHLSTCRPHDVAHQCDDPGRIRAYGAPAQASPRSPFPPAIPRWVLPPHQPRPPGTTSPLRTISDLYG